jgi:hypothetical protein
MDQVSERNLLVAVVLLAGAAFWAWTRLRALRGEDLRRETALRRVFEGVPHLRSGCVVAGTVEGEGGLIAPITEQKCHAYRVRLVRLVQDADYAFCPSVVTTATRFDDFLLQTLEGAVEVRPSSMILLATPSYVSEDLDGRRVQAQLSRTDEVGIGLEQVVDSGRYMIVEEVVRSGMAVRISASSSCYLSSEARTPRSVLSGDVVLLAGDVSQVARSLFADVDSELESVLAGAVGRHRRS